MSLAGLIFFYIGVSMGWLYTFMGIALGSSVVPIALCTTWKKANKTGCIAGSLMGFVAGLVAWLGTTAGLNAGVINVVTTGGDLEMLAGNVASICVGAIVALAWSCLLPENFDFSSTRALNAPHRNHHNPKLKPPKESHDEKIKASTDVDDKKKSSSANVSSINSSTDVSPFDLGLSNDDDLDPVLLNKSFKFALYSSLALLITTLILIPLPLFFAQTVYGVRGFVGIQTTQPH
ncbi:hypothetical protein C0992_001615 [Termitomyces sp. T32_za158]|nr:hypothetical protein C0992_001615 [Termitomyces sp. T32_za158]